MRILPSVFALLIAGNALAEPLSAEKAERLCRSVVSIANAGELERHVLAFRPTTGAEQLEWMRSRGGDPLSWGGDGLAGTLTTDFNRDGKPDHLGLLVGGGTCRDFSIAPIDRAAPSWPAEGSRYAGYSAVEAEEDHDMRWATWGTETYFMYIDGEPVVVTGVLGRQRNFGHERNELTLLSWFGEGFERPLCAFEPTYQIAQNVIVSPGNQVCRAVARGDVRYAVWTEVSDLQASSLRNARPVGMLLSARLDINADGEEDRIVLNVYDSGAGCGHDGLSSLDVLSADGSQIMRGDLEKSLAAGYWGPLPYGSASYGAAPTDYYPKLFKYDGKPYVLGPARTGIAVFSLWQNQRVQRCEIKQTPQFRIKKLYPLRY